MRYIGLVFFVFSTAIVYSQDYSNLIENGKYSKVLKKSLKVLKKTPNSIEDLYFASVVTSRVGAGNLYSPKQAYDYYIKAKVEYVKETDDKKLLKLDKIPINYTSFRVLSDSIYTGGLNYSINTNTEESFIEFLSYFVEATDNYKNKAVIERNRLAFEKCKSLNTIVGYREFIKKYALAVEVSEAWKGIHALSFQESLAKNTIEGYEEFISKFPSAIQVQEAVEKIHFLSYELALKENNSSAFKSFIDKYPKSKQVTKAKEIFYLLEFKENTVQGSWESYRDFYENFEGPYKEIAIDSIYFMAIKGNYQALEFILKNNHKYPKRNDLISSYFNVIKNRGEYSEIYKFYTEFNEIIESNILTEIDSLLVISKEVGELKLDLPYDIKNRGRYLDFIKRSGDIDINFVILQRIISIDISQKNYANKHKLRRKPWLIITWLIPPMIKMIAFSPPFLMPAMDI